MGAGEEIRKKEDGGWEEVVWSVKAAGKQDPSVERYSSIVVEKSAIIMDCRRIEMLGVIQRDRLNHQVNGL
jgi:hypothetical protein